MIGSMSPKELMLLKLIAPVGVLFAITNTFLT